MGCHLTRNGAMQFPAFSWVKVPAEIASLREAFQTLTPESASGAAELSPQGKERCGPGVNPFSICSAKTTNSIYSRKMF